MMMIFKIKNKKWKIRTNLLLQTNNKTLLTFNMTEQIDQLISHIYVNNNAVILASITYYTDIT